MYEPIMSLEWGRNGNIWQIALMTITIIWLEIELIALE